MIQDNQYFLSQSGVKGMKWGTRRQQRPDGTLTLRGLMSTGAEKAAKNEDFTYSSTRTQKLQKKADTAKESAKEWDDIGGKSSAKNKAKDLADSKKYDEKVQRSKELDVLRVRAEGAYASATKGQKIAAVLLRGESLRTSLYSKMVLDADGYLNTGNRMARSLIKDSVLISSIESNYINKR